VLATISGQMYERGQWSEVYTHAFMRNCGSIQLEVLDMLYWTDLLRQCHIGISQLDQLEVDILQKRS